MTHSALFGCALTGAAAHLSVAVLDLPSVTNPFASAAEIVIPLRAYVVLRMVLGARFATAMGAPSMISESPSSSIGVELVHVAVVRVLSALPVSDPQEGTTLATG